MIVCYLFIHLFVRWIPHGRQKRSAQAQQRHPDSKEGIRSLRSGTAATLAPLVVPSLVQTQQAVPPPSAAAVTSPSAVGSEDQESSAGQEEDNERTATREEHAERKEQGSSDPDAETATDTDAGEQDVRNTESIPPELESQGPSMIGNDPPEALQPSTPEQKEDLEVSERLRWIMQPQPMHLYLPDSERGAHAASWRHARALHQLTEAEDQDEWDNWGEKEPPRTVPPARERLSKEILEAAEVREAGIDDFRRQSVWVTVLPGEELVQGVMATADSSSSLTSFPLPLSPMHFVMRFRSDKGILRWNASDEGEAVSGEAHLQQVEVSRSFHFISDLPLCPHPIVWPCRHFS